MINSRAEYYKRIAELERKNNELKRRIDIFNGKERWGDLTKEFHNVVNILERTLDHLNVKNVKIPSK